jgi:hypothetical protein
VGKDGAGYRVNPNTGLPGVVLTIKININGKDYLLCDKIKSDDKGSLIIKDPKIILSKLDVDINKAKPPFTLKIWVNSFTPPKDFPVKKYNCRINITATQTIGVINNVPVEPGLESGPYSQTLSNIEDNGYQMTINPIEQ